MQQYAPTPTLIQASTPPNYDKIKHFPTPRKQAEMRRTASMHNSALESVAYTHVDCSCVIFLHTYATGIIAYLRIGKHLFILIL